MHVNTDRILRFRTTLIRLLSALISLCVLRNRAHAASRLFKPICKLSSSCPGPPFVLLGATLAHETA